MKKYLQFGLVGIYNGSPLDIVLPIITEAELTENKFVKQSCFYIKDLTNSELNLFCDFSDGTRSTGKLDIRPSCKPNSNISIYIVKMDRDEYYLYTYIDAHFSGLYPIPKTLTT